jgi:hypothetical protein
VEAVHASETWVGETTVAVRPAGVEGGETSDETSGVAKTPSSPRVRCWAASRERTRKWKEETAASPPTSTACEETRAVASAVSSP